MHLLLVLGGDLALTRSYSERWQVARIRLCGCGAGRLNVKIVHLIAARAGDL